MTISLAGKPDMGKRGRRLRHPILLAVLIATGTCLLGSLVLAIGWGMTHMPSLPGANSGLQIFDRNNQLLCVMFEDRDFSPVPLSKISKNMQKAIITSEDRSFYQHHGVDLTGVSRALFTDIKAHKMLQGGSTITQQLIKNLYYSTEKRTLSAKLQEVVLAVELDLRYPKEQILGTYLNYVYFGKGCYGIERAAEKFFGKTAAQLSLAECAYLAGLVNAPSELTSKEHHEAAIERQQQILSDMAKLGYVSEEAAGTAKKEKLAFKEKPTDRDGAAYYIDYVVKNVESRFPNQEAWRSGWKVYTNIDRKAQAAAQKTLTDGITKAPAGVSQGALVSISVNDGAVLSMVGGSGSYEKSPWNRALSAHTAGSAFKPFVYLTAMREKVLQPNTLIDDSPITFILPSTKETYTPKNFDGQFMGPLPVRRALALSRNVCAIKVAQSVGIAPIVATAKSAGIESKLDPTLSLALGASAVTPLELANSYATFARGGVYRPAVFIRQIQDSQGKIIFQEPQEETRVFDKEPVAQLVDMMQDVVESGTGKAARLDGRAVAGKTGTADGARDVWFVGFTPDTVTSVWAGNDEDKPIAGKSVTGGSVTAGIWKNYMVAYYGSHRIPVTEFDQPSVPYGNDAQVIFAPVSAVATRDGEILQPVGTPGMPPLAPDFRNGALTGSRYRNDYGDLDNATHDGSAKQHQKKSGGIGHFLHKIIGAFGQ